MSKKSVIIIGAGLAGLSAGCYAQMNGYQSRIFEHHSKPGGVAAAWERRGYLIDGGIHFLMGHRPGQAIYDLYCELGTAQADRWKDVTMYARFIDEASGKIIDVTDDLNRLTEDLKAIFPADTQLIDGLISAACAMQGTEMFGMMSDPPELVSILGKVKQFWHLRKIMKYFGGSYAKSVAEYSQAAHDPLLRTILENLFLPKAPVWFILMLLALLADGQMGLLEEGCPSFVLPIEQRYKALGGRVTYNATVEKILVSNAQTIGVRMADGREHRADVVVSAADGYSTIFEMLGGQYVDEKIKEPYQNWKLIRPTVMVSFGVRREFKDQPHLSVIMLENAFVIGNHAIGGFSLRIFNYGAKFAPPGKTVMQVMFETEWDFWNNLQKNRLPYEAEKARVAEEILECLETHYPGISSQVEMMDVATPYTTWRYTLNSKGAYMGWLPTPEAIMTQIPKTLPGLANFYMAGQWVMPGGGVPACIYSGRHVVQILCHKEGEPFLTSLP